MLLHAALNEPTLASVWICRRWSMGGASRPDYSRRRINRR